MQTSPGKVTRLLKAWCEGDGNALEQLAPLVEQDLRRLARIYLSGQRRGHTLQPTALINEADVRLLEMERSLKAEPCASSSQSPRG